MWYYKYKNKCVAHNNCIHNLKFTKLFGNEGGYDPRTFVINYMYLVPQDFIYNYIALSILVKPFIYKDIIQILAFIK